MKNVQGIECFLLDMDGTVYLGGKLIDGAAEAIERMRAEAKVLFITNNTSVSREDYAVKLTGLGIRTDVEDIYTAGNATIDYLKEIGVTDRVFVLGTPRLTEEFARNGIGLCADDPVMVVIGFDTGLRYDNLSKTCAFIRNGVPFIATHPDFNCPVRDGYIPDVGSFLALIEASTGRRPQEICGKPNAAMARGVLRRTGCAPHKAAMIGDRLMTDMRFASNNDLVGILVLSGEATLDDAKKSGLKLDYILDSIAEV